MSFIRVVAVLACFVSGIASCVGAGLSAKRVFGAPPSGFAVPWPDSAKQGLLFASDGLWSRFEKVPKGYQWRVVREGTAANWDKPVMSLGHAGGEVLACFQSGSNIRRLRTDGTVHDVVPGMSGFGWLAGVDDIDNNGSLETVYTDGHYLTIFTVAYGDPVYRSARLVDSVTVGQGDMDKNLELFLVHNESVTVLDGKSRVVQFHKDFGQVSICLRDWDGDGTFEVVAIEPFGMVDVYQVKTGSRIFHRNLNGFVGGLQLGDVDGDGKREVVTTQGDGGLGVYDPKTGVLRRTFARGWFNFKSLALLDLDGDGRDEAVSFGSAIPFQNTVQVFDLGLRRMEWATPAAVSDLQLGNFYNNPVPGAVCLYNSGSAVSTYDPLSGSGAKVADGFSWMSTVRAAETDADLQDELVVMSSSSGAAQVQTFDLLAHSLQMRSPIIAGELRDALGFLDENGRWTLAVCGADSNHGLLFLLDGLSLSIREGYNATFLPALTQVQAVDVDGDTINDLMVLDEAGNITGFKVGQAFPKWGPVPLGATCLDLADFDRNGKSELVVGDSRGKVFTFDLAAQEATRTLFQCEVRRPVTGLTVGDYVGSPQCDVVCICDQKLWVKYFDPGFGYRVTESKSDGLSESRKKLVVADLDGDGVLDIVAPHVNGYWLDFALRE